MTIDGAEVLRYLGWKGQAVDDGLEGLLREIREECLKTARPKAVRRVFPVEFRPEGVALEGTSLLLTGKAIADYLRGAEKAAVMACTLGHETDGLIRKYSCADVTRSAIFDAAAVALIESFCDDVSGEIAAEAEREGYHAGTRFSPGYGDLPLDLQPGILAALNAGRMAGITISSSLIMIPSKSVTAIVGLFREKRRDPLGKCERCAIKTRCEYYKSDGENAECGRIKG